MATPAASLLTQPCPRLALVNYDRKRHYHLNYGKHEFCILRSAPFLVRLPSGEVAAWLGQILSIRVVTNGHA